MWGLCPLHSAPPKAHPAPMRNLSFLIVSCVLAALPSAAAAQGHGGVASSGMGQGEARISSRSDVRLSMESLPGTSGAAVSALGTRVGGRMAQIRGCYEETVSENPTVRGTLRLRLLLERRGRPNVEVDRDAVNDAGLVRCISRQLQAIDTARLQRPTHAVVQLELANSAARGAERAATRAEQARQVQITIDGDGNPTTSGGTPDGRVRFTVTGRGRESANVVADGYRSLMQVLPGLMDCRRRAGRRGRSPAGDLSVQLQMREGRPARSRVTRSTVPNERTRGCVSRVLRRIEHRASGSGRVTAQIHYTEAEAVEEATD